jgi:hypothetical protein
MRSYQTAPSLENQPDFPAKPGEEHSIGYSVEVWVLPHLLRREHPRGARVVAE